MTNKEPNPKIDLIGQIFTTLEPTEMYEALCTSAVFFFLTHVNPEKIDEVLESMSGTIKSACKSEELRNRMSVVAMEVKGNA